MAERAWDKVREGAQNRVYVWENGPILLTGGAIESPYVQLPDVWEGFLWIRRSAAASGTSIGITYYPDDETNGRGLFMLWASGGWTDAYTLYEGQSLASVHWRNNSSTARNQGSHLPGMNGRVRIESPGGGTTGAISKLVLQIRALDV